MPPPWRPHADLFFLGVTGVHPEAGLTTGDADEAAMKRALARQTADADNAVVRALEVPVVSC